MKIVILAGGRGIRLWPLSRHNYPKQFLRIGEDFSLLQSTILRFLTIVSPEDLVIVSQDDYLPLIQNQCAEIGVNNDIPILLERAGRNTAPAFALAIRFLEERGMEEDEIILLSPADGRIEPAELFLSYLDQVKQVVLDQELMVLLGAIPSRQETEYGYIQLGEEIFPSRIYAVSEFVEKPKKEKVQQLLREGHVLWNTGHLLLTAKIFWEEIFAHASEIAVLKNLSLEEINEMYSSLPSISLDYALLEKSHRISVKKMDLFWSDVGSWDGVYTVMDKEAEGNVIQGDVLAQETKNSLLFGNERLIVAIGVENLLVVDTKDALFVSARGESHKIKQVIQTLKLENKKEAQDCTTTFRPWGYYTVLQEGENYKVKKIVVNSGCRLSLQVHKYRSEHWVVVSGLAYVEVGDRQLSLQENQSIFIPAQVSHRLTNQGIHDLEIIEVQSGEILSEEDIVRLEDDYAREESLSHART